MAEVAFSTTVITRLITPVVSDLYKGAKGVVKRALNNWSTEAGIKSIAISLSKIDKVKTVWSPENEISLNKFYYPSKVIHQRTASTIKNVRDLPDTNIVIEGIVGQGKSIFMRHLATSMIKDLEESSIPVFIELRTITPKRSLLDAISLFLDSVGVEFSHETLSYLAKKEKIALLLDGFDEIPQECVNDVLFEISTLQMKHPLLKIIISSRPHSHIQNALGFEVIKLQQLEESDYDPFIAKLIPLKTKRFDVVNALDTCSENIRGLISTPLMLTLVVMIYQTEKEIPTTLSSFFDKLFGVVFSKHDKLKAGFNRQHHSGLSEDSLKTLFETFCFMSIGDSQGRSITGRQFNKSFTKAIAYHKDLKCSNDDFRKDIIKVSCLMLEEGIDTITFLHKSILDYHAAAFVRDLSDIKAADFYRMSFLRFKQWEHVLQFLESIDNARYIKEYTLKNLPSELSHLSDILATRSQSELIKYINDALPNSTLRVSISEEFEFTHQTRHAHELHTNLIELAARTFFDQCRHPTIDKLVRLAALSGNEPKGKTYMVTAPLGHIIQVFGDEMIWNMLTKLELAAIKTLDAAQKIANREESKDNILDEMFSL